MIDEHLHEGLGPAGELHAQAHQQDKRRTVRWALHIDFNQMAVGLDFHQVVLAAHGAMPVVL